MTDFDLRVIVPPAGFADPAKLIRIIENTLDDAADGVKMEFQRTTGSWNHKPEFVIDRLPGKRMIYTTDIIYKYVSGGTEPHPIPMAGDIYPGRKPLRFYRTGFRPKSRVNSLASNKGKTATKDLTFAKWVWHPGTAARNFDLTIQKRWKKFFPQQLQRAVNSEFR